MTPPPDRERRASLQAKAAEMRAAADSPHPAVVAVYLRQGADLLDDVLALLAAEDGPETVVERDIRELADRLETGWRGDGVKSSDLKCAADKLRSLLAAVKNALLAAEDGPELDNHHNALTCPYCNPKGLKFAAEDGQTLAQPTWKRGYGTVSEASEDLQARLDKALNTLSLLARQLPAPPWWEAQGGSDWEPWCAWLREQIAKVPPSGIYGDVTGTFADQSNRLRLPAAPDGPEGARIVINPHAIPQASAAELADTEALINEMEGGHADEPSDQFSAEDVAEMRADFEQWLAPRAHRYPPEVIRMLLPWKLAPDCPKGAAQLKFGDIPIAIDDRMPLDAVVLSGQNDGVCLKVTTGDVPALQEGPKLSTLANIRAMVKQLRRAESQQEILDVCDLIERLAVAVQGDASTRCRWLFDPEDIRTRCILTTGHDLEHACPDWPGRVPGDSGRSIEQVTAGDAPAPQPSETDSVACLECTWWLARPCRNHINIAPHPLITEITSSKSQPAKVPDWLTRWLAGEQVGASTGICGSTTYGYGRLDHNGYWEIPVPAAFMERLAESYAARAQRQGGDAPAPREEPTK